MINRLPIFLSALPPLSLSGSPSLFTPPGFVFSLCPICTIGCVRALVPLFFPSSSYSLYIREKGEGVREITNSMNQLFFTTIVQHTRGPAGRVESVICAIARAAPGSGPIRDEYIRINARRIF